jgi:hypothetical protein
VSQITWQMHMQDIVKENTEICDLSTLHGIANTSLYVAQRQSVKLGRCTVLYFSCTDFSLLDYGITPSQNPINLYNSHNENLKIYNCILNICRYSDSLRAGRSGDRVLVGARFSARPDRPWGPHSLPYNGYRVFPGGKVRPGRAADHSPPSSAKVLEE